MIQHTARNKAGRMYEPQRGRGNLDDPKWSAAANDPSDWRHWVTQRIRDSWGQMSLEARSSVAFNAADLAENHRGATCAS